MDNIPKKDVEIKNRIRSNSYDILEIAYEANMTIDIDNKKELIFKMMAKAKIIDFLLNLSYDKKIITEKNGMTFHTVLFFLLIGSLLSMDFL